MTLRQVIVVPIVTFMLFASILSCETDNSGFPIGEDWVSTNTKVYFIDTMTIKSSTFKFDSLSVSNTDRLLIGAYIDPVFGFVKSKSYVQLSNDVYTIDDDAIYDSIALILISLIVACI